MKSAIFWRALISIALAYPASAIPYSVVGIVEHPPHGPNMLFEIAGLLIFIPFEAIFTVITGGFPFADETGINRINMYPWIVPTAVVIFFLLSRGLRWAKRN